MELSHLPVVFIKFVVKTNMLYTTDLAINANFLFSWSALKHCCSIDFQYVSKLKQIFHDIETYLISVFGNKNVLRVV